MNDQVLHTKTKNCHGTSTLSKIVYRTVSLRSHSAPLLHFLYHAIDSIIKPGNYTIHVYWQQPMSRPKGCKERPTTYNGFDFERFQHLPYKLWTFPQVGNLPLWSLRICVKQAQRTACRRAPSTSCFSARAMRIRV